MGIGILESKAEGHVPGTVLLDQHAAHSHDVTGNLKHGTGKHSHIILAPQPSEDPNDPLNWSRFKKDTLFVIVWFGMLLHVGVNGTLLNAGIVQISQDLNTTTGKVADIIGSVPLATGAICIFVSAFGRKYGKRPQFVFASVVGTIAQIVGAAATGESTLLASRVLSGFAVAAYEALSIAVIGDMYFVHQRGPYVAMMLFSPAITNGCSIIAGLITKRYGWHYNFYIFLPFCILQLVAVVMFSPETVYRRKAIYEIDTIGSRENLERLAQMEDRARAAHRPTENGDKASDTDLPRSSTVEMAGLGESMTGETTMRDIPIKKTWVQELSLYNGSVVQDSVFRMMAACVVTLGHLGALYMIVTTGVTTAFAVGISVLAGVVFAMPPFLKDSESIGYMSAGPLIGGFVALVICFSTTGPIIRFLTRHNRGIYEPEFHLIGLVWCTFITVGGLVGMGYAVEGNQSVELICFCWGLVLCGFVGAGMTISSWALDAFRAISTEVFIMGFLFKNFFYYGIIRFIIQWSQTMGFVKMSGTMAGICAGLYLLAIPVYVFGKRYRAWWAHYGFIKTLHLETDKTGAD
ncbi:hypothetical protein FALCPG4_007448 [Fusarium falciforme]